MIISTAARNALADAFDALFTAGSDLVLRTAGNVAVATIGLPNPAFGAASSGTIQVGTVTPDTNAAGGTVSNAVLRDGSDVIHGTLSVGTAGAEVIMSSLTVSPGSTVTLTALTVTMPTGA